MSSVCSVYDVISMGPVCDVISMCSVRRLTTEELQREPKLDKDSDGVVTKDEVDSITMNKDEVRHCDPAVKPVCLALFLQLYILLVPRLP